MDKEQHLICAVSWGNDSCALVQWIHEQGFTNVDLVYNDTGWAAAWWPARVERMERWAQSLGFRAHKTQSVGMEALVKQKKSWPRNGMQFCTEELKIKPSAALKALLDPNKLAICVTGVRRAESERRASVAEFEIEDERDDGRHSWRPLFAHSDEERDALLARAGIAVLPHRSGECKVCINASRKDIASADEETIADIERIESELGFTSKGKPRTMFRPAKKMGATGIREVQEWAKSAPRSYKKGAVNLDDEPAGECSDLGYCGV